MAVTATAAIAAVVCALAALLLSLDPAAAQAPTTTIDPCATTTTSSSTTSSSTTTTAPTTTVPPTTAPPTTAPPTTAPPTTAPPTTAPTTTTTAPTTTTTAPTTTTTAAPGVGGGLGRSVRLQAPTTLDPCLPTSLVPIPETTASSTTTTEAPTTTVADSSGDSSEGSLRWVVIGLVAVAGALAAITVLYWKHTRPGAPPPLHMADHGTAPDVDTSQVAALVGLPGAAVGDDPDPTAVGVPTGLVAGELPTYESVYGETPYAGGTTGAAGALLAAGEPSAEEAYEYVEVDEAEIDDADGYEYMEVEVEVDDDDESR